MRPVRAVLLITAIGGLIAAAGPLIAAHQIRQRILPVDYVLAALILVCSLLFLIAILKNKIQSLHSLLIALVAQAFLMTIAIAHWRPALEPVTYPQVAAQIDGEFRNRSLALFEAENLPICFYLSRTVPYYQTREELMTALLQNPDLIIIWEQQGKFSVPPPGIVRLRIPMRKRQIIIYEQK